MSEERVVPNSDDTEDLSELDEELGLEDEEEAEPEPETEPEPEPEAQPEPTRGPRTREERRIAALRQQRRERDDEIRRLREQNERLLVQSRPQPQQPDPYQVERDRQEAERVAMMAPHEQAQFYANRSEQRMQQHMLRQSLETRDLLDRQLFENLRRDEPAARRLADQVESTLAQARQQGMNPTREAIYNLLIGQEYRAKAQRQIKAQQRRGRNRIDSQTTRPGTRPSSVPSQRGRTQDDSEEAIEARLSKIFVSNLE